VPDSNPTCAEAIVETEGAHLGLLFPEALSPLLQGFGVIGAVFSRAWISSVVSLRKT